MIRLLRLHRLEALPRFVFIRLYSQCRCLWGCRSGGAGLAATVKVNPNAVNGDTGSVYFDKAAGGLEGDLAAGFKKRAAGFDLYFIAGRLQEFPANPELFAGSNLLGDRYADFLLQVLLYLLVLVFSGT